MGNKVLTTKQVESELEPLVVFGDVEDAEQDSESEGEQIPGTLDEAPPVGTWVKILYEEDEWCLARVTASNGTKATVVHGDNEDEEELDFDVHAVRLSDYVSEDEE